MPKPPRHRRVLQVLNLQTLWVPAEAVKIRYNNCTIVKFQIHLKMMKFSVFHEPRLHDWICLSSRNCGCSFRRVLIGMMLRSIYAICCKIILLVQSCEEGTHLLVDIETREAECVDNTTSVCPGSVEFFCPDQSIPTGNIIFRTFRCITDIMD